jgi:hypothetical protein
MAKKLKKIFSAGVDEVAQLYAIESWHVSQSIDAFTGTTDYDITVSGSSTVSGSALVKGTLDVSGSGVIYGKLTLRDDTTSDLTGLMYLSNERVVSTMDVLTYDDSDSSRPAISGSITGGVNLSSLGKSRGVGLVLPLSLPPDKVVGSMYVDIEGQRLYIYNGTSWNYIGFDF